MSTLRKRRKRPLSYWLSMFLFGVLAVGLAVFFWVGAMRQDSTPVATPDLAKLAELRKKREMVVRNLTLQGRDEEGNPFRIEAARSRRPKDAPGTMILEEAIGEIRDASGAPVQFEADMLIYRQTSRLADLKGNVVIEKPDRWTLTGPLVQVDTRNSTLRTDQPVVVQTEAGVVRARGMRSDKKAGRTIFKGPVHAIFDASGEAGETLGEDEKD